MHDQSNKFSADNEAGYFNKKTYHDILYKNADGTDKSLFGKISSLFGLMLAGAGSGLAHQENSVLKMMDNEITQDVERQKANSDREQNLYKINGENLLKMQEAGKIGGDISKLTFELTLDKERYLAYDRLAKEYGKLPDGHPLKEKAGLQLIALKKVMEAHKSSAFANIAVANALAEQLKGGNTALLKSGAAGEDMARYGEDVEQKTVPGIPGMASRPIEKSDRDQLRHMDTLDNKVEELVKYASAKEGSLSPSERATAQQMANELVGFYSSSLGTSMTEGTRTWLDEQVAKKNPTSVIGQELLGSLSRLKEIQRSNKMRKQILLDSYGFNKKGSGSNTSVPKAKPSANQINSNQSNKIQIFMKNNPSVKSEQEAAKILKDHGML